MQMYELIVHGSTARDLAQARGFLTGDAHDQSKVQMFDAETTTMLNADTAKPGNYPVCAYNGEQGSLLVTEDEAGRRSYSLN